MRIFKKKLFKAKQSLILEMMMKCQKWNLKKLKSQKQTQLFKFNPSLLKSQESTINGSTIWCKRMRKENFWMKRYFNLQTNTCMTMMMRTRSLNPRWLNKSLKMMIKQTLKKKTVRKRRTILMWSKLWCQLQKRIDRKNIVERSRRRIDRRINNELSKNRVN